MWLILFLLACAPSLAAEAQPDVPLGAPYRTGTDASVPLRDFLSARIDALRQEIIGIMDERDRRYDQRASLAAEASKIALDSLNERLRSVNEFRATLADQQKTFATRDVTDAVGARIDDALARFNLLNNRLIALESTGGPSVQQNQKEIAGLSTRLTEAESRSAGASSLGTWLFTAVGALFGAVGVWVALRRPGAKGRAAT